MDLWSSLIALVLGGVFGAASVHWLVFPLAGLIFSIFDMLFRRDAMLEHVPAGMEGRNLKAFGAIFYLVSTVVYCVFLLVGSLVGRLVT